jgi:predicted MFS family arabinose efflux permease
MRNLSLQIAALTAARTVLNTMHRLVYPFLAVFARGLGVELSALSLALTLRAALGVFGPLLGSLADTRGRRAGLLTGLALFTGGVTLVVFFPTFPGLLAALALSGLGKLTFDPAMQAYLGDQVPYARRGRAIAITELSWSLAFILGIPAAGFLIARSGWMAPFPLLALLGLLSILGLRWLLPPDPAVRPAGPGWLGNLRLVGLHRPSLLALAVAFLITAANEVVNLVFGVWMEDAFGLQILALGAASAVIGLSELGGEGLAGLLSDRLGKERAIGLGLLLNSAAALALPAVSASVVGALAGLFVFYLTFEFTLVSIIPLMTEILPTARATLMAASTAVLSLGRAGGALLAPVLYAYGFQTNTLTALLINLLALLALGLLLRAQARSASHPSAGPPA